MDTAYQEGLLQTTLVVQVEQLVHCVCVRTITCERQDLLARYVSCWFILTLYPGQVTVKVTGEKFLIWKTFLVQATRQLRERRGWLKSRPEFETVNN